MNSLRLWGEAFSYLNKYPRIIFPFVLLGLVNALVLYLLYLAPQRPVSFVLGPPIMKFTENGYHYLHYPHHLYYLPKLFYFARIPIGITAGVIIAGAVALMLKEARERILPRVWMNFWCSMKRYFAMALIWAVVLVISMFVKKGITQFVTGTRYVFMISQLKYVGIILTQFLFIYTIPILIIHQKNVLNAFRNNFIMIKRFFIPTVLMVVIPSLFYFPFSAISTSISNALMGSFPEIILIILFVEIVVSMAISFFLVVPPSLLVLEQKGLLR